MLHNCIRGNVQVLAKKHVQSYGMWQENDHYRSDGVRITHDPYEPGMAEKYGLPDQTDPAGFDPYADTVGPGIYGGSVKRDPNTGNVIIGRQYQDHNPLSGPAYDGTGHSIMSRAIAAGPDKVKEILSDYPELAGEISTGGATPLHMCGMSKIGQDSTQVLINAGADIRAVDTYGMNALHRMASNNLHLGAEALVNAGLDRRETGKDGGRSPVEIARSSRAIQVIMTFDKL